MRRSGGQATQKYLDIERALAIVQGRLALIPQEAADEIVSHCTLDQIDMGLLRQQTERIGYPILGVVSQLNKLCRDKLGEYCHWGATTQDITDTATVLQIREALELVDKDLAAIAKAMARLRGAPPDADDRSQQPQQAIPVTFGYKMAGLLSGDCAIASGWRSCASACWSVSSAAPPARWPAGDGAMETQAGCAPSRV
jgi:3-carboxy-cis,cis-muconate cycloisomerase